MSGDWHRMSALALGAGIENGTIDPRALTEFFLERIEEADGARTIYLRLTAARARAEAEAAHRRAQAGLRQSSLDGVPISWKDLYDSAGDVTSHGTPALAERIAERDAKVLARATRAGLVCLGKTNQTEFAFSILGLNPKMGTPANPFDDSVARIPGGSSSGAAVSVARSLAAAAIGSDTGGSVRVPAAWNGLVGLKTSFGLLPLDGVLGLSASMDTVGPLTRDVADAAALFAVLDGRFGTGNGPAPDLAGADLSRARFALPTTLVWEALDPGVEAAARGAVERLRAAGCAIEETPVPEFDTVEELVGRFGAYHAAECHALWHDVIEANPDLIYAPIYERIRVGAEMPATDAARAKQGLDEAAPALHARIRRHGVFLMPTAAESPPPIAALEADDEVYRAANTAALRNTRLGNYLNCCALTLPCGRDRNGVPVGLMLMAPPGDEERLLRLGSAIEPAIAEGA
ncbi:MAG: amidase family protein [Rhodospirillales bacterium]|nr:amidase family protein [Rhodospirillales bacterium]